jgi:hypothetical protein
LIVPLNGTFRTGQGAKAIDRHCALSSCAAISPTALQNCARFGVSFTLAVTMEKKEWI